MASPVNSNLQPVNAVDNQADSMLVHMGPDLLGNILSRMEIREAVAFLSSCRFTLLTHFENMNLWMNIFNSRFPGRAIPKELGPFAACKDIFHYRYNLKNGIYAACYPNVPKAISFDAQPLYDSKIISGNQLFQWINRHTINIIDLETGESSLFRLYFEELIDGELTPVPHNITSFTVVDQTVMTTATAHQDRTIKHWDIATRSYLEAVDVPADWLHFIAIPGGRILAYLADRSVKVCHAKTLECQATFPDAPFEPGQLKYMCFAEDRILISVRDPANPYGSLFSADIKTGTWNEVIAQHPDTIVSFAPLGQDQFVTRSSQDNDRFQTWNLSTRRRDRFLPIDGGSSPFAIEEDEGMLFVTNFMKLRVFDLEKDYFHTINDWTIQHPERGYQEGIYFQSFAGRKLIMEGSGKRTIEIRDYDARSSTIFRELADRMRFPPQGASKRSILTYVIDRFERMPQSEKEKIYRELFLILSKEEKNSIGYPETLDALSEYQRHYLKWIFIGQLPSEISLESRAQAIENYLAKEAARTGAQNQ